MSNLASFERELLKDAELVARILREVPPSPAEPERVIRCSRENLDRALCRATARAVARSEVWRLELVE